MWRETLSNELSARIGWALYFDARMKVVIHKRLWFLCLTITQVTVTKSRDEMQTEELHYNTHLVDKEAGCLVDFNL
ncbi:hypothetical protein LY78DRAFT_660105 [Colletotrichum sublineola]|nr:hypothetical protein LY78DRAFT_660105 [Colletotrichum sublineola]